MIHFLRCPLFHAALLASAVLARAGVSYDESAVFSFDTRDYLAGLAAESVVFSFDTRGVDGLQGAGVSGSFAFDTRGATLPPLQISGVLRDSAGVPVVGATIQIKRAGAIFWQGVSGAGGAFTTPNLSGVNYTVIVTKPGYVTSITNITGTAGGLLALNVQISAMPAPPVVVDGNRIPLGTAVGSTEVGASVLKVFKGGAFITDFSSDVEFNPNRPTIILSHGWLSSVDGPDNWVTPMALQIRSRVGPSTANIVAWDWVGKANRPIFGAIDVAAVQGEYLGKALRQRLGASFNQHLHFIGHSFGTIVNAYACDYVHGRIPDAQVNAGNGWVKQQTTPHITLLDEAELGNIAGRFVLVSAAAGARLAATGGSLLGYGVDVVASWKDPVPADFSWADNYISAVAFRRDEAVNVSLLTPTLLALDAHSLPSLWQGAKDAHSYAPAWYRNTILNSSSIGFGSSWESGGTFPPTGTGNSANSLWWENIDTPDAFDISLTQPDLGGLVDAAFTGSFPILFALGVVPGNVLTQNVSQVGQSVLSGYEKIILWEGNIGGTVIYKTGQVVTETTEKVGLWWDASLDAVSDVLNSVNPESLLANPLAASVFKIRLQTQAAPAPLAGNKGPASLAGQPAYAWVTVAVPAEAGLMAFDFTVTGDPQEDKIACAINDQNVFTLPAKFAPDGQPVSTDMIDVSAYAGQSIELFFGLAGGTSTNCEVAIDGLRFITVPPPKIALAPAGANVAIKWPAATSGWVLESSDALAPANWQTVSTASGVTVDSGVATVEELMSGSRKFYRLRRAP